MSQTAIAVKSTYTATGSASTPFQPTGRDSNGNLTWRQAAGTAIQAARNLAQSCGWNKDRSNWKSKTTLAIPVMETIASGASDGYVAQPRVAGWTYFNLEVTRSPLMSDADVRASLYEFAYAMFSDAAFVSAVVGFQPADT